MSERASQFVNRSIIYELTFLECKLFLIFAAHLANFTFTILSLQRQVCQSILYQLS